MKIDSIEKFDKLIEGLLKDSFDSMVENFEHSIVSDKNFYENQRLDESESIYGIQRRLKISLQNKIVLQKIYRGETNMRNAKQLLNVEWAEIIHADATESAMSVQDSYKSRLQSKLYEILNKKALADVELVGLKLDVFYDTLIDFKFVDGSEFRLNSQIVLCQSSLNTLFYRFPNIYQNVKVNGQAFKKRSEEQMMAMFAGLNPEEKARQTKVEKETKSLEKKIKKQAYKYLKICNESSDSFAEIGMIAIIDNDSKKWIESVTADSKIEVGTDSYYFIHGTVNMRVVYKDGTDITIEVLKKAIIKGDNIKSSFLLNDKKLNANLGIEFYHLRGQIKEIHNIGSLSTELYVKEVK